MASSAERAAERILEEPDTYYGRTSAQWKERMAAIIAEEDAEVISALREALYRFPHSGHCDHGRCLCDVNVQRWRAALAHAEGK